MRKAIALPVFVILQVCAGHLFAQNTVPPTVPPVAPSYPYAKAYLTFIIPWVTISKTTTTEFQSATTIGFPVGLMVYSSKTFGFGYEITPSIAAPKPPGFRNPGPLWLHARA
jgi:hypothetical protein